jgi:hypothetical protein
MLFSRHQNIIAFRIKKEKIEMDGGNRPWGNIFLSTCCFCSCLEKNPMYGICHWVLLRVILWGYQTKTTTGGPYEEHRRHSNRPAMPFRLRTEKHQPPGFKPVRQ